MERFEIVCQTEGDTDLKDLTPDLTRRLGELSGGGVAHLFVVGSTAALTTIEFEPGLVQTDFRAAMQRLAPEDAPYDHEATWNDDNGHAHVRASTVGPSLTIPFAEGRPLVGPWQQVVLIDFDTRPRRRTVIVTVLR